MSKYKYFPYLQSPSYKPLCYPSVLFVSVSYSSSAYQSPFPSENKKATGKILRTLFVSFFEAKIGQISLSKLSKKSRKVFVLICGYVLNCGFWVTRNTVLLRCFSAFLILFEILTKWKLSSE